jgi:hypothetical protein
MAVTRHSRLTNVVREEAESIYSQVLYFVSLLISIDGDGSFRHAFGRVCEYTFEVAVGRG